MNIQEGTETKAPAKKKRKPAKKRVAAEPRKATDGVYAGMSVKDCCNACNEKGCVISGKPYCAHPRKGGLHAAEMQDSAAMARRREAEKVLGRQKLVVEE
jgi:hypothetical protein